MAKDYLIKILLSFIVFFTAILAVKMIFSPDKELFIFTYFLQSDNSSYLDDARNYYSVVQSIFTIIFAFFGLILGYFYYSNRKKFDKSNLENSRIKTNLDKLYTVLDSLNEAVLSVLNHCFENELMLNKIRMKINQNWDIIETLLETNSNFLEINDADKRRFIKLNAYIQKNSSLIEDPFIVAVDADFNEYKMGYLSLIKDLRLFCLSYHHTNILEKSKLDKFIKTIFANIVELWREASKFD